LVVQDASGAVKSLIKIFRSIFVMVFVAHLLGCVFLMMIDWTGDPVNWLSRYDASLMDSPNEYKYVAAMYW
jgi:hypothetical protein